MKHTGNSSIGALRLAICLCGLYIIAGLSGCTSAVGPDYQQPALPPLADNWHHNVTSQLTETNSPMHAWWQEFDDEILSTLIGRAQTNNLNLDAAVARLVEARAILGVASGNRWPNIQGTGAAQRQSTSEGISLGSPPPQTRPDTLRDIGAQSSWEFDLWGRVRRSIESAGANYAASQEDLRDVLVLTYADIGSSYIQLRTLQERLRLANANVTLQRETLALVRARHQAELAPDLELRQAELNLAVTESSVPSVEAAIARTIHRLSVLIGEPPQALRAELYQAKPLPKVPEALANRLPADVIRQRPDIRRAERTLAAQTAQIGVATAALYPNFFISGNFSVATATGSLFNATNETWGVGANFSWNLFNAGRVRSAIKIEEAKTEQALVAYEQRILFALQDVEDSLVSFSKEQERLLALGRGVTAAKSADQLVQTLYRQGLTNFQNVLDTQRSLFAQEDGFAQSQGTVLLNLISVYRAFGGGWDALPQPTGQEK